jgi:hypothetical protein
MPESLAISGAVCDDGAADLLRRGASRVECRAMNRGDATNDQAKRLSRGLYPVQNYLYRLRRRMDQVGFPLTDPMFALVDAAYDAVHRLRIYVHYMTCDGVGEHPRRAGGERGAGG